MSDSRPILLPDFGILAIDGPDAATFLQGQATCDTRLLSATRGSLGALCNLQGRMIVSFHVLPAGDGLRLVMARDRVAPVLAHLKKYAVFAKVTLRDDSDTQAVAGNLGDTGDAFTIDADGRLSLRGGRTLALTDPAAPVVDAAGADAWQAAALAAGELLVDSANADRYLPQALNYDLLDGVSFRKGCYTGQEVVARMHFKGRMKERLYIGHAAVDRAPAAQTAIVDASGRTVGTVVAAASVAEGCRIGAVLRHDAVRAGGLHVGSADGPVLVVGEQPVSFDAGD